MPKCEKCSDFFPPNYTKPIPNKSLKIDGTIAQQCVFCENNVDFVVVELGEGKTKKYTKGECKKDYYEFTKKIKESGNLKGIIKASKNKNNFGAI